MDSCVHKTVATHARSKQNLPAHLHLRVLFPCC